MGYLTGIVIVTVVVVTPVLILSRVARDSRPGLIGSLVLMLLLFDPYTSGRTGGHTNLYPIYPWQQWATALLILLLLLAGALAFRRRKLLTYNYLIVGETTGFLLLNAIYLVRDGFYRRAYTTYEESPMPLIATLAGTLIRAFLLHSLARRRDGSD